MFNINSISMLI